MKNSTTRESPALKAAVILSWGAVAWFLWHCWCVFPQHSWNELRLQPAFLFAQGIPVYAEEQGGPLTTWIYGPLPFLFLLPATIMSSAGDALLCAGTINLGIIVSSVGVFCLKMPTPVPVSLVQRLGAWGACLACWPRNSFQYLQADNFAIAFTLLSALVLIRNPAQSSARWLAAACGIAAIGCKQTALEGAAAQVVWLAITLGRREAFKQFGRLAVIGGLFGLLAILAFGFHRLWFNLLELPGQLPWDVDFIERLSLLAPALFAHFAAGGLVLLLSPRHPARPSEPALLLLLCWLLAWPTGLASALKLGGSWNSLHSGLYLLPALWIYLFQRARSGSQFSISSLATACAALAIAGTRIGLTAELATKPLTVHLQHASFIAREFPGQVWFPWNPIVAYYDEHRFDHTEDGLVIRQLAWPTLSEQQLLSHLPPRWHATAMRTTENDWGLARRLGPVAETQLTEVGLWQLRIWPLTHTRSTIPADHQP